MTTIPEIRTFTSRHFLLYAAQEKLSTLLMCKTPPDECDLAVMINYDFTGTVYNMASSTDIVLFEFENIDELYQTLLTFANIYS